MNKNMIIRDTSGRNGINAVAVFGSFVLLLLVMGLFCAVKAFGQDLPTTANAQTFQVCVDELVAMNPDEGDMTRLVVGDVLVVPGCAGGDEFFVNPLNANMVRKYGGWGIVFSGFFNRFPTDEEFARKTIPSVVPVEEVAEPIVVTQEASTIPWWITFLFILLALAIVAVAYAGYRAFRVIITRIEALGMANQAATERQGREIANLRPTVTDEDLILVEQPFSAIPESGERQGNQVYQDMETLAERHMEPGWIVDRSTIERGKLRASAGVIRTFRYNPRGVGRNVNIDRPLEVTAYRATARRGDEERQVFALFSCMNWAEPISGEEDYTFSPEEEIVVHPLVGTVARVTNAIDNPDGSVAMTLVHDDLATDFEARGHMISSEIAAVAAVVDRIRNNGS